MHFVKTKSILSNKNGINLYRGCLHGCIYCDSRSDCYQMNHEFEDIEIKENALELLEEKLDKKAPCMIGTGAMSDPYIPIEKDLKFTKGMLELIDRYGFGVSIQTKSNLIMRDMDLLEKINNQAKAVVQITLTTFDDELCKIIEPNVVPTSERIKILMECKKRGIPTVVWLCPILPFINDTVDNIENILKVCKETSVYGIICFNMGLTLRDGNREYFYEMLDKHFPGIKNKYIRFFKDNYEVNSLNNRGLMDIFHSICRVYGIQTDIDAIFEYLHTLPKKKNQMSIFDFLDDEN
ncbi:MAG: radical SAM protein [Acholeplasmatales bacterium]|nr:radical SAM protein [Acholeplasmatales bacterium]